MWVKERFKFPGPSPYTTLQRDMSNSSLKRLRSFLPAPHFLSARFNEMSGDIAFSSFVTFTSQHRYSNRKDEGYRLQDQPITSCQSLPGKAALSVASVWFRCAFLTSYSNSHGSMFSFKTKSRTCSLSNSHSRSARDSFRYLKEIRGNFVTIKERKHLCSGFTAVLKVEFVKPEGKLVTRVRETWQKTMKATCLTLNVPILENDRVNLRAIFGNCSFCLSVYESENKCNKLRIWTLNPQKKRTLLTF